jgi:GTP:adenosylcobinamide-phosphate guanylyltransferase
MDVVMLAGGIPKPDDPLYPYTKGKPKALLDVGGRAMIQWVLDALNGAESVDRIVLVGLEDPGGITSEKPIYPIPNQGRLFENIKAGTKKLLELDPEAEYFLMTSSDIPAITAEMVEWVIKKSEESDHDLYYNVVERETMEERFPGANRTFAKLRGVELCGADLSVVRVEMVTHNEELWIRLAEARKSPLKQAALIGFDTLLMVLFRMTNLEQTARRASKRVGIDARAIVSPYAELAMDVDKPHQLEILIEDRRQSQR